MKKLLFALLALTAIISYTSCTPTVDDVYDKAYDQRKAENLADIKSTLESAKNGWVMYIYGNQSLGGYNLLLKFHNDSVVASSELNKVDTISAPSHYQVGYSAGPILSFDEYNSIIHQFSDPVNQKYGTNGKGFEGDLEYRVQSYSADSIVLLGKKHENKIVMLPLAESTSWKSYLEKVKEVDDSMFTSNYDFVINGKDTIHARRSNRVLNYTVLDKDSQKVVNTIGYCITDKGMRLYEPISLDGQQITGFTYQPNSDIYTDVANSSVTLKKRIMNPNALLVDGTWYIDLAEAGAFPSNQWKIARSEMLAQGDSLLMGCLGTYSTEFAFTFALGNADTGYYLAALNFDYKLIGKDEISMTFNGYGDALGNGLQFLNGSYGVDALIAPFGYKKTRTFKVETDDLKRPSYMILTDKSNRRNKMKLVSNTVYFPLQK
ncbi:DUF4302 domain-containing protein [Prevotella sp. AGR2160]|uniref:DUF4302 domain-containing protein n=1 Tax=Prevotella sp. AGR2160 TaxID=1280674 RepID=UPI00041D0410|nr:DUF4302 domain-containing protein [Prevotella sp. AGR2160]